MPLHVTQLWHGISHCRAVCFVRVDDRLGDGQGNVVHLLDRDCSVQRRHQKVVETAPADTIPQATRDLMFADAVRLTSGANYRNAGTVEPVATAAERLIYQ